MPGSRIAAPPAGPGPEAPPQKSAPPGSPSREEVLRRSEVRDVVAWLRLLLDPHDASAVVRALARPPVELRQVDLARVIQLARRRRLDLVGGLAAATESPQVPPDARERIQRFLALHGAFADELDRADPTAFVAGLIERLGTRGRTLLAPDEAAGQRASLDGLRAIAAGFVSTNAGASAREVAAHLASLVPQSRSASTPPAEAPLSEAATDTPSRAPGESSDASAAPPAPGDAEEERLQDTLQMLRAAVLDSVARIGGQIGELRLDTELDVSHGVVRYLELLKVAALLQRPEGQSLQEALSDINTRLLAATTPLQREIYLTSALDGALVAEGIDERAWAQAIAPRGEPSLGAFLPRRGQGLALSASDVETYRSCPLRYKFGRVLRIPTEQTLAQRFGIAVHQVLERYHSVDGSSLEQLLDLLDAGWRRGGLGDGPRERDLYEKARTSLTSYHARLSDQQSTPVWFERQFSFRLGPHQVRGRVDRVDRVLDDSGDRYELIDYKTSRPKTAEQLRDDVQLSLYALAAREAWGLECSRQAYYYVLDDVKVPVPRSESDQATVEEIVMEVGEGILAQRFEPTPSPSACSICDHRIVCPAAEV